MADPAKEKEKAKRKLIEIPVPLIGNVATYNQEHPTDVPRPNHYTRWVKDTKDSFDVRPFYFFYLSSVHCSFVLCARSTSTSWEIHNC